LQTDTGKMVWEKTGADRAVFRATSAGLIALGGYSCYLAYIWAFPQN